MWSIKDVDVCPNMIAEYETASVYHQPTARGLTWVEQHALWLHDRIKAMCYDGTGLIQCRIEAIRKSLTT